MISELQRLLPFFVLFFYVFFTNKGVAAQLPLIDFDRMGTVGIAGEFSGLDFANNSTFSFDSATSTLLSRSADGSLIPIASTNTGGRIITGCSLDGVFYLAGSFSSIDGMSTNNVASYNPSTGSFSNLGGGLDGQVDALHCDQLTGQIWTGGAFQFPTSMPNNNQFKGSVAIFDVKQNTWLPPPFGGLRGGSSRVQSIIPNFSGSSLYFSGSFIIDFKSNATVFNGTNNPNVPFSVGATAFSSSLVPIPLTPPSTQIEASPSTSQPGFSNISNILCPAGPDGPGNTWLARDASTALITVETFQFSTASGIRLGNTFVQNRGTTAFTAVTLPNNKPLTFNYVDPVTLRNLTCSASCPLGTNSSVLYQDFLFDGVSMDITGFQLTLTEWQGAGAGLHILQLLSSGAFASAVESINKPSCFAPVDSTVQLDGSWIQTEVPTSIAAATQPILVSNVSVGTSSANSPSITWMPYVSAPGDYDINLLIPGCLNLGDCSARTSVKVTVFPGIGLPSVTTTVRQDVQTDTTAAIYRGPVIPSLPDLQISIQMELADTPVGTGQNGQFQLIADRVQLVLISVNFSASAGSGSDGFSLTGSDSGFGFFEWVLSDKSTIDATGLIPNSTETPADALGMQLFSVLGINPSQNNSTPIVNAAATDSTGIIFVGGSFETSSGMANIAIFKDNTLSPLTSNGLNGAVTSLIVFDETLYVGGSFTDTAVSSGNGAFRGVVSYDIRNDKWMPLLAGINGDVSNLNVVNGRLDVAGNFTLVPLTPNSTDGFSTNGLASWDIQTSNWVNSGGFLNGVMTLVSNGTTPGMEYVAGSVSVVREFGSDGLIMISNGNQKNGEPTVTPLAIPLASESQTPSNSILNRRSFASLRRRQVSSAIPTLNISSPAILAGAFWANNTSSAETTIIGGQFATSSGTTASLSNLAFYDTSEAVITGPHGDQVNGTVKALKVIDNTLYVGGQFTLSAAQMNGFAIYDLGQQQWETSFQALQGPTVDVTSVTTPSFESDMVIVGGTFSSAGSLPCQAICRFDTSAKQWNQLGSGIEGQVTTVGYTSNPNLLIAAGSIKLSDGTSSNVAAFDFSNNTWSSVGNGAQIPGPVTAFAVDNGNMSSIFAAGISSDGSGPFVVFWNGHQWSKLDSSFANGTSFSQLTVVPLQNTHPANGIIEPDRVLLISGALTSSKFGNASSAVYDGRDYTPYFISSSGAGAGFISQLFNSLTTFSFAQKHFLPVGLVILISIGISTAIIFLLLLVGILWTLFSRHEPETFASKYEPGDYDDDSLHRPSSLLAHINAATRSAIIGAGLESPLSGEAKGDEARSPTANEHEQMPYTRAVDTPVDAAHGTLQNEGEDVARPAHVRYSFDGDGQGELRISSGAQVIILDDRDAAWWYARDPATGREGVIPASYLY
ncbi:hypothetical protein Clacol_000633 [Clathrus columnatus]|uniref:SH3 domain-containing protein n=1 Tax=Clathrus columnatus TaxID=1419009 RepID=A0AAV5A1H6_9AGAM|nr:hypothetical protein Clacol_000633 [Clathrus columnatus]